MPANPQVDSVNGLPLINLRRIPLDNVGNALIKRTADIVCALLLIVLTSPLMLIAAIGVKLSSPGPIIFKQERVGKDKKPFYMYKFRSMIATSESDGRPALCSGADDRRLTRVGRFLREHHLDELPQLWNVLKGEMSFVGPRPEVERYVRLYTPYQRQVLLVRPGITD